MKKTQKKIKPKTKLLLLQGFGGAVTFAPLIIAIGINFKEYFSTTQSAVSMSLGGAMAVAVVVIQLLGKGKKMLGSAIVISGIVFAFCIFLEPLILNLKLLTGTVFLGEAVYAVGFKTAITNTKKQIDRVEQTTVLTDALKANNINGRV